MTETGRPMHGLADVMIERGGPERIPELKPLWESLETHHDSVASHLAQLRPPVPPERSWEERRAAYKRWLAEPDAFLMVAVARSEAVGYALAHMGEAGDSPSAGQREAELETLSVLAAHRGRGIGTMLLEAVYEELRRLEISQISVSVIASNAGAVRFYERHGFQEFLVSYIGAVPPSQRP